jgi:hypothetical protein
MNIYKWFNVNSKNVFFLHTSNSVVQANPTMILLELKEFIATKLSIACGFAATSARG